jgi:hypothetical protein
MKGEHEKVRTCDQAIGVEGRFKERTIFCIVPYWHPVHMSPVKKGVMRMHNPLILLVRPG